MSVTHGCSAVSAQLSGRLCPPGEPAETGKSLMESFLDPKRCSRHAPPFSRDRQCRDERNIASRRFSLRNASDDCGALGRSDQKRASVATEKRITPPFDCYCWQSASLPLCIASSAQPANWNCYRWLRRASTSIPADAGPSCSSVDAVHVALQTEVPKR